MTRSIVIVLASLMVGAAAPAPEPAYDIVIRGGRVLAPDGIGEVIVNGVVALAKGQPTGSRSGSVLRHPCPSA